MILIIIVVTSCGYVHNCQTATKIVTLYLSPPKKKGGLVIAVPILTLWG